MPEKVGDLSQSEIDLLTNQFAGGTPSLESINEIIPGSVAAQNVIKKASTVASCLKRYCFALTERYDIEKIKEIQLNLHAAAFSLWCANRGITKGDYYEIMKREIKKRGLKYVGTNPPGFKLVRVIE